MIEKRYPSTILATACIPWDEKFKFQEETFRLLVRGLVERGVRHIYIFGTAGEGYAVSDRQFDTIVNVFSEEMTGEGLHPVVGLISLSFSTMIERVNRARSCGIREFQFALPNWAGLSRKELFTFFHGLCDRFPDCRFLHYNLPRSNRMVTIGEYEELADRIPNLAAVKYSTQDMAVIHSIMSSDCPMQFFFLEGAYGYGSMFGECGFLISKASMNFERAWEYFEVGKECDYAKIAEFNNEFAAISRALHGIVSGGKIDGAYDKIFAKFITPSFPLRLLPPYETSGEDDFIRYFEYMKKNHPQWLEGD